MEDCMSSYIALAREQRERLKHLVLLSLRKDANAWRQVGHHSWKNDELDMYVSAGVNNVHIYDGNYVTCLAYGYRTGKFMSLFRKPSDVDRMWDILHSWRHRQVEAQGQAILDRFERNRTAPEVSRLKELVDATRG